MDDLLGIGKGTEKLIDVIANAVGAIYRPYGIRKEAEAEAYKIKLVESAKTEQKAIEIRTLAGAKRDELLLIDSATSTIGERAEKRKLFNELRRQTNLENVLNGAFNYIGNDISKEPVDPDWIQALIGYAEEANSEQIQDLWSRVLAGETELPGSFSLRAMETLKKMSRKNAELFQRACQISSHTEKDDQYKMILAINPNQKGIPCANISLHDYGYGLMDHLTLVDLGLIYDEKIYYAISNDIHMIVGGYKIVITPITNKPDLISYNFTQIGNELAKLINISPYKNYLDSFVKESANAFSVKLSQPEEESVAN